MTASLRLILLLFVLAALPARAAAQPGTGAQPAPPSAFAVRVNNALARYNNAHQTCDEAGKRAAAAELNALADEARAQLAVVRTNPQFATITLAEAQKQVSDTTLAIEAARTLPPAICPPRQPAPPATQQPATPRTAPPDSGAVASPRAPAAPERDRLSWRGSVAVAEMEEALDRCNMPEMERQMAILDTLAQQARLRVRAARTAGAFSGADTAELEDDLGWVETWHDIGRRMFEAGRLACRVVPRRLPPPEGEPGTTGPTPEEDTSPIDIYDPNFPDPLTENAREAARDHEEARQACDDEAMRAARLRLDRLLDFAEELARLGATIQGTNRRPTRLREIATNRVRDIRAIVDGLGGVPVNCPPDPVAPAPVPPPPRQEATPPPPAPPAVPRQRAIRGLFGMGGVGYFKEEETDLGFASLGGGYRFGDRFGVEGEAAIGLVDEENEAGGFSDSFALDFDLAAYATLYLPVAGNADLFARAGYGYSRFGFSLDGPGISIDDSDGADSFRYGLGGQLFFDEANGVRVTWTRWDAFEDGGVDADVFVISYVRRFGGAG